MMMNANFRDNLGCVIHGRWAILVLTLLLAYRTAGAAETWQEALSRMPLEPGVTLLTRTNFAATVLGAFQSNEVVKALVLMPGCTDEFYFFRRGVTRLSTSAPTLLDAVNALTNQTAVQVTFRAPFLLLHTVEDPLEPGISILDPGMVEKLRHRQFVPHMLFNDRDWDFVQPILMKKLTSKVLSLPYFYPRTLSRASWHFYRHSLAGWNLDGWETLQALSFAGKTTFTVYKTKVVFEGDTRIGNQPNAPGKISPVNPK